VAFTLIELLVVIDANQEREMPVYNYTTLDDPAAAGGRGTFAEGINDAGPIVGLSKTASRANTNFLRQPSQQIAIDHR